MRKVITFAFFSMMVILSLIAKRSADRMVEDNTALLSAAPHGAIGKSEIMMRK